MICLVLVATDRSAMVSSVFRSDRHYCCKPALGPSGSQRRSRERANLVDDENGLLLFLIHAGIRCIGYVQIVSHYLDPVADLLISIATPQSSSARPSSIEMMGYWRTQSA